MKVVFDTNIFIAAFAIPGSQAEEAYIHAMKRQFSLYSSVPILTEMAQKLREKFGWQEHKIARLLKTISIVAVILKTETHVHLLADEPDNRILECAIEANADFIITGDKHLLSLKRFQNISILKLSNFLEVLKR